MFGVFLGYYYILVGYFCREILTGQRGVVYEIENERVAVILDRVEKDGSTEEDAKPPIYWIPGSFLH